MLLGGPQPGFEGDWPPSGLGALLSAGFLPDRALVFDPGDPLPAFADAVHLARRALLGSRG